MLGALWLCVQKPFGGGATGGSLPTILFAPEKRYSTFLAQSTSIRRRSRLVQFCSQMAPSFIRQERALTVAESAQGDKGALVPCLPEPKKPRLSVSLGPCLGRET